MVRFTYKYLKPVALFLAIAVLFQCCKVYEKQPVTLEQAINADYKSVKLIKIRTVDDNKKWVFDSIYYKNDRLYGLKANSTDKKMNEILIIEESIENIYLLDTKKSRTKTTLTIIFVPIGIIGAIFIITLIDIAINGI